MGLREFYARQKAAYGRYQRFHVHNKGCGPYDPWGTIDDLMAFLDDMGAYPSIQYRRDLAIGATKRGFDAIRHGPFKVKCAYQRVRYGVSVRDIWSLDYYLAEVLSQGMTWLDERDVLDRSDEQEDWNLVKTYMTDLAHERVDLHERMEREPEVMAAFGRIFPSLWE